MRIKTTHFIENPGEFKLRLLIWSQQFREVLFLDSNDYPQKYSSFDCLLAVDAFTSIKTDHFDAFKKLDEYQRTSADWLFGYMSYDLKNDVEDLVSANYDGLEFPDLYFFQPKKLFILKDGQLEISYLGMCDDEIETDIKEILEINTGRLEVNPKTRTVIRPRIDKNSYLQKVGQMLAHLHRGDIYEANFCMEFFAEDAVIDPLSTFKKLNDLSRPPFAAFFKNHKNFALCASPERYLRKTADFVISQPIKGTSRRDADPETDVKLRDNLQRNEKEQSENIMIVDLVRNDLSRTASKGSVEVEELCGVHTFPQVHHLISTITSRVVDFPPAEILRTTFPMGSMTGAPKISAMKIIDRLEESKRGLYSGAIGYFTPEGDFDFNVVIRSILYDEDRKYLSFSAGSAITAKSDPEQEYNECMVKADAMRRVVTES